MAPRITTQLIHLIGSASFACGIACSSESIPREPGSSAEQSAVPSATTEHENKALYQLDLEPGHKIALYEPEPGVVFPVETMKRGQRSLLAIHHGTDLLELFAGLRPGEAVPEVVMAAHERSLVAKIENLPGADLRPAFGGGSPAPDLIDPITTAAPGVGAVRQAVSSGDPTSFINDEGGCTAGTVFGACRVNWWNGYWTSANAKFQGCVVDHFYGDGVTVRFQAGSTISDNWLEPGTVGYYWNYLPKVSMIRRIDIIDAQNDGFHVGCYWGTSY
jgi:hypothetical protein